MLYSVSGRGGIYVTSAYIQTSVSQPFCLRGPHNFW